MIASHFLQVFIVVQPLFGGDRYRVSVTRRADVPDFLPQLPVDGIFDGDDETFSRWLLAKLINAEHACYGTKKLSETKLFNQQSLPSAIQNTKYCQVLATRVNTPLQKGPAEKNMKPV